MHRLTVRGKYIYDGAQKFFARGVSYGPFTPNSRGERYPEPARTDADFALMRELGANLVRTYVPPPPWMFELAAKHQLRMMVGMPWPFHMAFLDSPEMMRDIRDTIRAGVRAMKPFADVIFAYSLGNEIRSDIVRWHGPHAINQFLRELYDLGRQSDPDGLFTFSNYPSAEYLDLNFLDVVSFNVYLHSETDFRRYLTHLLATTRDRPLILSETGMDTIREGEEHQAELLQWQARAASELGLSGFIVFAFTDEWHTGGAEITDWAFGLVTRERERKRAFAAVAEVFRSELPSPLVDPPPASVVVCAYNAAKTIGPCLASLKQLNYPAFEIIVVDDGSTDATAQIAKAASVRLVTLAHQGLSAARNAGLAAAANQIVAFIDADAEADRDWLYHLVETLRRKDAAAVGGQNVPPANSSALAAAIAAAPGEPREVRAGDDELDQVCGCSMALNKAQLPDASFDAAFTTAGDDVDFSWSLRERGLQLAYAPGAMVLHRRRATIGGYLRQQFGYGHAEAQLARKYPDRAGGAAIYGDRGWMARWFGAGARVYYGAFGRGLFQTLYRGADFPLALQIPLMSLWVGLALLLILIGSFTSNLLLIAGLAGLALTIASAAGWAWVTPLPEHRSATPIRLRLALLCLLGPLVRSFARAAGSFVSIAASLNQAEHRRGALRWRGQIVLPSEAHPRDERHTERLIDAMRTALWRRGAKVTRSDRYQPYDLLVETSAGASAALNFLVTRDDPFMIGWKLRLDSNKSRGLTVLLLVLGLMGASWMVAGLPANRLIMGLALAGLIIAGLGLGFYLRDARLLRPLLEVAADDAVRGAEAPAASTHKVLA